MKGYQVKWSSGIDFVVLQKALAEFPLPSTAWQLDLSLPVIVPSVVLQVLPTIYTLSNIYVPRFFTVFYPYMGLLNE